MARKRQSNFMNHGAKLLQESIAFCNGRTNPIRNFSADQLHNAVEDFRKNHPIQTFTHLNVGILDGRLVFIKKYARSYKEVYRDIVLSSKMSSHNNALKLLGCCLELPAPALVYEYAENGSLHKLVHNGSLQWKTRLKIAKEIASAVAYLHTAFPRTVIHRDIKPSNIFLDQHYVAKLFDFSLAVEIPEGESHAVVDDNFGILATFGFLDPDPDCFIRDRITEKADVYSFGVLLLILLTGRTAFQREMPPLVHYVTCLFENGKFNEVVDPTIWVNGEAIEQQQQSQLEAFLELALRCTRLSGEDRPSMIEVAKELQRINERSISSSNASLDPDTSNASHQLSQF